jgi:hypothetical protein
MVLAITRSERSDVVATPLREERGISDTNQIQGVM